MSQSTVLVVEDDLSLRDALCDTLRMADYAVVEADDGRSAVELLDDPDIGIVVTDIQMRHVDGHALLKEIKIRRPQLPVMMMTAYGTIQDAVKAMRDGAVDYLVKPFAAEVLVNKVEQYVTPPVCESREMVAVDPQTRELVGLAHRVATTDATVMITGESGTGKEVLARFIHRHSGRAQQPFVAINCAAIPENMLEAILFGYEKGAFTGAVKASPGKFEQAQNGTLLLDEISEMSLALQAKLLRVLQEREVERLGGNRIVPLDVRVLATSNSVMREEVAAGRFREDLFYRLNVFPLHIPSLCNRPLDILPLADHTLVRVARAAGVKMPTLSSAAEQCLLEYPWPGNVREMDNVIQRALILAPGNTINKDVLHFEPFHDDAQMAVEESTAEQAIGDSLGNNLKTREQSLIIKALKAVNGNRKIAATKLGISQRTLRYKLARMRQAGITV